MATPLLVRDLMVTELVTLDRHESLDIADKIMSLGRIRHLPVVDKSQRVCGIVSQRDLFRSALGRALGIEDAAQAEVLKSLSVEEVMIADPVTVSPQTPVVDAARIMLERKFGCLPVTENDKLVGLLTEADFVRHICESQG